ncbi:MAG: YbhN family protein [Tepidisphaeraceae bacterium]
MDEPKQPNATHAGQTPLRSQDVVERIKRFFNNYAGFILRNIIGWILILISPVLGAVVPGPGGFPVFIIGFALVTFPGKRKMTARFLRGRRLKIEARTYAIAAAFFSIAIPGIALWVLLVQYRYNEKLKHLVESYAPKISVRVLTFVLAVLIVWIVTRLSLKLLNGLLLLLPRIRRRFRPWMKRQGLKLLPPRRKKATDPAPEDEILEIAPRHQHRIRAVGKTVRPWIWRAAALGLTVWIFTIMIRPLHEQWPTVREQIREINPVRFALASLMFATFLLCFRALVWRRVLKAFGHRLPYGAATRIWATSELARYLPGAIWQVVGRVYLARPYGVGGTIVSTSQILEVFIFLFANVLVAGSCLLWFGQKMDPYARPWLITAMLLVPGLALCLHPRVFYGGANWLLARLNKPPIVKRLRGAKLVELLVWMILGLVYQGLGVYVITDPVLHLKLAWWWVVAGAYCLAWCAGFLAFWAPGGIGVRELVFVAAMQVILPQRVRETIGDEARLAALLVLLGFMLRLWTVVGEGMLVAGAHLWDWRGALGRSDAPGRIGEGGGNGSGSDAFDMNRVGMGVKTRIEDRG